MTGLAGPNFATEKIEMVFIGTSEQREKKSIAECLYSKHNVLVKMNGTIVMKQDDTNLLYNFVCNHYGIYAILDLWPSVE